MIEKGLEDFEDLLNKKKVKSGIIFKDNKMNKVRFTAIIIVSMIATISTVYALEKKPINSIDTDQLNDETFFSALSGEEHLNLIWWFSNEFWQATCANDETMSECDKKQIINTLKPYSILMVCQADISAIGSFKFYSKDEIEGKLDITFKPKNGRPIKLIPLKDIDSDLRIILDAFKPILSAAVGNMGKNMHFFVLKDFDSTDKRKIDPYRFGTLNVQIEKRSGELMQAQLDFPLNSLYVPRKCPNGKNAHVTWKYCPWTGKKLDD